ncbi:MAG TPA: hypothetical protein VHS96_02455 [Bacteroidia bacterium]|jgi:hypothetical protein|nr:hypothetical protein [Bacteroidia bacterium]
MENQTQEWREWLRQGGEHSPQGGLGRPLAGRHCLYGVQEDRGMTRLYLVFCPESPDDSDSIQLAETNEPPQND